MTWDEGFEMLVSGIHKMMNGSPSIMIYLSKLAQSFTCIDNPLFRWHSKKSMGILMSSDRTLGLTESQINTVFLIGLQAFTGRSVAVNVSMLLLHFPDLL